MHKQKYQHNTQNSSQKNITSLQAPTSKSTLESTLARTIQSLDPENALSFLDSLQQNIHQVFCLKAQLCQKLFNSNQALQMCLKAFQCPPLCTRCLTMYMRLNQILLPRKLCMLDSVLQRCQNDQNIDPQIVNSLRKIKQSQNLDQDYQDFLTDLLQGGVQFSKLSIISKNSDNRSVIAKTQIQKDETLLYIPKKKLILLENARESEIVKKIHEQRLYLRSPKHCYLTIYLLQQDQLGQPSAFRHYLQHFPKNFDMFPVNYKDDQLEYLKGSPFLDQVQQKSVDIRRDYDAICSVYPQFVKYSFQSFKKYRLLVSSRIFGVVIDKNRTDALAPLADMLNHHIPKQTSWFYSDQQQGFMIKSLKKIQKGEQIYDSYGLKCNSRFLLNYGFTLLDNDANQVSIKIPFEYEQEEKVQIYRQMTLKISKNIQSQQFYELLAILRHSVVQQAQKKQELSLDVMKETLFISLDVEAKIWQKLQKILEPQLSAYPTTLKEDRKLLGLKDLSVNHYNCIILRKGEKQILTFYLTMAKKMIKHFRTGSSLKNLQQLKEYEGYLKQLNFS